MADFDLDSFLDQRAQVGAGDTPAFDPLDYAAVGTVQLAGTQKAYDLDGLAEAKKQNLENSLIGKMGIEAESFLGDQVNKAASLVSGVGRLTGDLATLPLNYGAMTQQTSVEESAIQAFNRMQAGTPEEGDEALLAAPSIGSPDELVQSNLERLQAAQQLNKYAGNVREFFDWSSIVDTTNRDELSADIKGATAQGAELLREAGSSFEQGDYLDALLSGAAGAVQTVGTAAPAAATNPGAVLEYAAENLPQLLTAGKSVALGVASNVGYAADQLREGFTEYAEENAGQIPEQADRIKMTAAAASLALAEQVGDLGVLKAARGGSGNIASGVVSASSREGVTEGYQTWAEAQSQLNDATLEEIIEGATIGAAVGGTYAGAGATAKAVLDKANEAALKNEDSTAQQAIVAEAAETGDVSALIDPTSESYNPEGAVSALHKQLLSAEATPEVIESSLAQADSIEQELTKQVSEAEQSEFLFSEQGQERIAARIAEVEQSLADEANPDRATAETQLKGLRALQAQAAERTPEDVQAQQETLEGLRSRLASTREAVARMQVDASPSVEQVQETVTQAASPDLEVAQPAAEKLMTLTMTNPDVVDMQQVRELASNPESGLNDQQRVALRSFGEAQAALNELSDIPGVRTDIQTGGDGFKGLPQYRNAVRVALAGGNTTAAQSQVEALASFAQSRAAKFDAISTAYDQVKGTNNTVRLMRDEAGTWVEAPANMTARQLKSAGGVEVSAKSFKLRDAVGLEATALSRAAESLSALVQAAPVRDTAPVETAAPITAEAVTEAEIAPVEEVATPTAEETALPVSEEAAPESANAAAPVDVAVTGELTAIREAGEVRGREVPSSKYQRTNLVSAFFEQTAAKDEGDTKRPLVEVPDFASAVRTGQVKIADFTGIETFTAQQQAAVRRFFGFQKLAKPIVEAGLKQYQSRTGVASDYYFRDYAQFLIKADGTIDENLVTAISYAAFSWANDAAGNLRNTDAGINAILGRDSDEAVEPAAYKRLSTIGTRDRVVMSQMGAKAVQVLGLNTLANAPANERARLEASLGAHAMQLLIKSGLAKRTALADTELQTLMASNEPGNPRVKHFFLAPTSEMVDGRLTPSALAKSFREATVGSQSVLDKLFGSDQGSTEPSFEPAPFNQQLAKRTQQEVPSKLADILKKEGERAHFLRQDMWQVWGNLSSDALYKIAGVVDTTDVPTHQFNRASREAKNDGLRAQVDQFAEFFGKIDQISEEGIDQPLYFGRSVWKPQRVGLTANVINPQTSKVHRHMLRMEEWNAKIAFADQAALDGFKLRVLEAFGVKTEAKRTVDVLAGYDAKVNTPAMKAGINALAEILAGNAQNVTANEQAILAAVAEGGENFHSLDAITALAQQKLALDTGADSFETSMMGEVDGVTNGPMLSLLMLGAKGFETLNQGGFFSLEDQYTQFNDFHAEAGNLDLYESSIAEVIRRLGNDPLLASLEVITGNLTDEQGNVSSKGRKVIKQPLTAMMFGSNTRTAVNGMADGFVTAVYERLEEAYDNPARIKQILSAVNKLIASQNKNPRLQLAEDMSAEAVLNTEYNAAQTKAIKDAFYSLLGEQTEKSLEDTYAVFLARRDVINQSAGLAYELFEAARDTLREAELATADLPRSKAGESFVDLTQAQNNAIAERLKSMTPILHTALSKASDQLDAGMLMSKSKRQLNDTNPYMAEVHFGQPVDYVDVDGSVKNVTTLTAAGMSTMTEGPGVAPLITSIHSSDSNIASSSYANIPALNIHDALGTSLDRVEQAGQELNKNTFETMLNYSTASEMVGTLERTVAGFVELMADETLAAPLQAKLKAIIEKRAASAKGQPGRAVTVTEQLEAVRHVATESDTAKLSTLTQMKAVGQYATDGGSYIVTDADRAAATEALNKVGTEFSEIALDQADTIDSFAAAAPLEPKAGTAVPLSVDSVQTLAPSTTLNTFERVKREGSEQVKQDAATVEREMVKSNIPLASAKQVLPAERAADLVDATNTATKAKRSVWGELGVPVTPSDKALVDLLSNSEGITARGLAQALEARSSNPFNKKLLQALTRLIREDMPVIMVTAETGPEGALGRGVTKARGWYASQGDFDAVYIKSTDFVESGITEEMLTHEMLHSVTGRIIQSALDNKANSDVIKLVNELEALRKQAEAAVKASSGLSNKYANAVSSVHELVSWGMTNTGFQEEVLKGIQVAAPAAQLSGLQKFIDVLTRLVFRGSVTNADRTGMGLLIANTSGLFAEAKRQMDERSTITLKYEDAMDSVNEMTTQQIFAALASNKRSSAAHEQNLTGLLDSIVSNLHGPMGAFRNMVAEGQAITTDDVFIKALDTGKFPFASAALSSAFVLNQQEAFVLEQVEVTIAEGLASADTLFVRASLERLWNESKAKLNARSFYAGDWNTATAAERAVAQEKYDFLFKPQSKINGKTDVLSRFAALGLASEEVANALNFATSSGERNTAGMSLGVRLLELFRRLVTKLGQLHDKTRPGEIANARLFTLVDRLVDIEAKRRGRMASRKVNALDQVEEALASGGAMARTALDKIGQSAVFKSSSSPIIRFAGNAISTVATDRVEAVLDGITRVRDTAFREQQGLAIGILTEMRGITGANKVAHELNKQAKNNEVERKQHIDYTVAQVNESFKDNGEYLTQQDKDALTRTLLRTNMSALSEAVGMDEFKNLIESPAAMQKYRADMEQQVLGLANGAYYIGAVKDLAYNRTIGGNVSPNLMMNTSNIARLYGTNKVFTTNPDAINTAIPLLDQLVALYSYEYAGTKDKSLMREVLRTETARGQDNGIAMILKLHAGLLKSAKDKNFEGTEALAITGYVPDLFDSKIEVIQVDAAEMDYFAKRGYQFAGNLQEDALAGLSNNKILMTRRGSGQIGILSGALSYSGMQAKGTKVDREAVDMLAANPKSKKTVVNAIKGTVAKDVQDMFNRPLSYDPRKQQAQRVAPIVNPNGEIVDYRYMMTEHSRDSLLDRDNSVDQVLGTMAGQIIDKVSTKDQNIDVVRAMYDQYREDFNNRPSSYLQVGKDSEDPQLAELYKLLPQSTKDEIRKVWKNDNMLIPADQLNLIMGYRKYSLTTPFGLAPEERNIAEKVLVSVVEALPFLGAKAALRIGQAEDVIQELVKEAKDILVVKNIFTLVGNIVSNITILAIEGVSIADSARTTAVGIKGAMQYREDNKRLIQLNRVLEVGYLPGGDQAVRDEITMLVDRMGRNPVKPLIDAGLMPTIVEDVEVGESQYSYKSLLQKKAEKYSSKLPKFIRDVGRNVYMTHDTGIYKFLSQSTQLSDLVSRYALYEHLISRARDPLSKADALQQVEEAFVNYDVPSHRSLQFMNDMGLVMFTKYYLRIQKVLMRLMREKPARVLGMVLLNHYVSGLQSILDSSWLNKLGNNPFQLGPWSYPSSLDELPAIKGLMNL